MSEQRGPVLIELDEAEDAPRPDTAPAITDTPKGPAAMERAVQAAARPPSRLGRLALGLLGSLVLFVASLWAWDFVTGLLASRPTLGAMASVLVGGLFLVLVILVLRELIAFSRLRRIDGLRRAAEAARAGQGDASGVVQRLVRLYRGRSEMNWALAELKERQGDVFDAKGHLDLAERVLLEPLDRAAEVEIEAAARQVATVTAVVPLALADVSAALFANMRMIRRVSEIYGGRGGALGNWRLTRSVMAHLVATGAVAVGDDLIGSVAGGGLLSKVSRRFGEGVINGALTARVGVAAMEVCRPMPFDVTQPPRVTALVRRALTGLFGTGKQTD